MDSQSVNSFTICTFILKSLCMFLSYIQLIQETFKLCINFFITLGLPHCPGVEAKQPSRGRRDSVGMAPEG